MHGSLDGSFGSNFLKGEPGIHRPSIWSEFSKGKAGTHRRSNRSEFLKRGMQGSTDVWISPFLKRMLESMDSRFGTNFKRETAHGPPRHLVINSTNPDDICCHFIGRYWLFITMYIKNLELWKVMLRNAATLPEFHVSESSFLMYCSYLSLCKCKSQKSFSSESSSLNIEFFSFRWY